MTDYATDVLRLFLANNLLVSNLVLGSISVVWGFINSLQIIAHIPLLNIILPGNAKIVYDMTYTIATFDIITMDYFIEMIEEPLSKVDNSA